MSELAHWLRQVRDAMKTHNYATAAEGLKQAAGIARRQGDHASEGRFVGNLAVVYQRMGRPQQALRSFDKALAIARSESDRVTEEGLLGNMGGILRELGHYDYAIAYLKQAIRIAEDLGDFRGHGNWLSNLGLVYDDLQHVQRAIEHHAESVQIARDLQDQRGLANRLDNLGNSYIAMGDYASGLNYLGEAADLYHTLGQWHAHVQRLEVVGNLYCELARNAIENIDRQVFYSVAIDYYQQAFLEAHEQNDRQSQALLLRSMGNVFMIMGDYEQAIYRLVPASQHYSYLQQRDQCAEVQRTIAVAQTQRKKPRS